jgi:hypothetical protein
MAGTLAEILNGRAWRLSPLETLTPVVRSTSL